MSAPPTMPMDPGQPGPQVKKTSPLVWILAGIGIFVVLCMVTCGIGSYFLMHKIKDAGFDSSLMQKNPGLAMAKMVAAMNPDLEVVSSNDRVGTVTVRERSTGKTMTYKFDSDKKSLVIVAEDGSEVKIGADSGAKLPSWVPAYPGATIEGSFAAQGPDGSSGSFSFKTPDSTDKVTAFYQDQLKSAGFTINVVSSGTQGGMVSGEDTANRRTVIVMVNGSTGTTSGSITVNEKK
jgi:hypothetical protein